MANRDGVDGYWFAPKAFGIGATPVTWQGWMLTLGFAVLAVLDMTLLPNRVARVGVLFALLVLFMLIAIRKTRGGWSWHWGGRG